VPEIAMARASCALRVVRATLIAAAGLGVMHGCSQSPVAPSCSYTVSPASQSVAGSGGNFQAMLATAEACQWSATVNAAWITLETPQGTGPGPVMFHVAPNGGTSMRAAAVTVQGQGIEIRQEPMAPQECAVAVSPSSIAFGAAGGAAPLAVTAPGGCRWTATTSDAWITLAGAAGDGNGPMLVSVAANTGALARTGTIRVGTGTVTVTQTGEGCDFDVAPTSRTIDAAGGSFTVTVATAAGCEWHADADDSWLDVSASRGTGPGQVTVSVAPHTATTTRTGTLRIGGHTVTVTQSSAPAADTSCAYSLSSNAQPAPATGGSFSVNVITTAGCAWTASSSDPWVTITAGQSGSGSGQVGYTVAANPSPNSRTATLQIANETLTITQPGTPAPCIYTVAPATQAVPAAGGVFSFTITTAANCQWTAATSDPWVGLGQGSGAGTATLSYKVAPNQVTRTRTGTIQVNGETHTITQAGAAPSCSFTLDTTSQAVPAAGGTFRVTVKTATGCDWTASSNQSWVVVTAGSKGSGPGTVSYRVLANSSPVIRSAVLTVASHDVKVSQAGIQIP
jgi:hypothetical protein